MVQQTAWKGKKTKSLGVKGVYTRYQDRPNKKGLELVKPTKKFLIIMDKTGKVKNIETKYGNFSGNESTAKKISKEYNKLKKRITGKYPLSVKSKLNKKSKRK